MCAPDHGPVRALSRWWSRPSTTGRGGARVGETHCGLTFPPAASRGSAALRGNWGSVFLRRRRGKRGPPAAHGQADPQRRGDRKGRGADSVPLPLNPGSTASPFLKPTSQFFLKKVGIWLFRTHVSMHCNLLKNSQARGSENRTVLEVTVREDSGAGRAPAGWRGRRRGCGGWGRGHSAPPRTGPAAGKPHPEAVALTDRDPCRSGPSSGARTRPARCVAPRGGAEGSCVHLRPSLQGAVALGATRLTPSTQELVPTRLRLPAPARSPTWH